MIFGTTVIIDGQNYVPAESLPYRSWQDAYGAFLVGMIIVGVVILLIALGCAIYYYVDGSFWRCRMFGHKTSVEKMVVPLDDGGTKTVIYCKRCLETLGGKKK